MSSTAQQEEIFEPESYAATGTESAAALKQLASERLAAHRRRRAAAIAAETEATSTALMEGAVRQARTRSAASRVRDAVAARYKDLSLIHI